LIAWLAAFAVGFIVHPFGAIVFGRVGDMIGRKYTFQVTMTLMGLCTFAVGLLPTIDQIGPIAGAILIFLRILPVLALGGEYGGATCVAEHSPDDRRGFHTSWIQITATLGGNSVFGGMEPIIGLSLIKATGNNFAGLWYPMALQQFVQSPVISKFLKQATSKFHLTLRWPRCTTQSNTAVVFDNWF